MALRVCSQSGCPNLVTQGRCQEHRRAYEATRGTRQARGYDAAHERLRKRWIPKVAAGKVTCWRCGERLSPLKPWDLGHVDGDKTRYAGPECIPCNRATSGR